MGWRTSAISAAALTLLVTGCGAAGATNTSNGGVAGQSGVGTAGNLTSGSPASGSGTGSSNATQASTSIPVANYSPLVGKSAPAFTVKPLNGKSSVDLKSLLKKGEPLLVNAFASWCPPCNMEAPDLVNLANKYKGKVQVIGLDMTSQDTMSGLKKFVKEHKIDYPVLLDTKNQFEKKYGVTAYPSTFAISPSGKVILFHLGYMTKQDMNTIAQKLEHSS
ncbi:TlpA disulfide reductase family protein [Alicyclobacillus sp. SO9]|uniref:TlpA disulfide reductase family protein n=1 Tax=Alicyclobacillus sp. SO9 TaxID=2665646 RepID=UPI0018E90382|nr:TlpA disulfide reductase family protein [Alicyclobacillus sp. SO9]QQE77161.1 TlpA family protein disulfide reductase [Alicyclobacillus sp. SO9]